MTSKRPTHLPHGRWLGDFPGLSTAEKQLVAHCARGEWFEPGDEVPEKATAQNRIRAELIRFLLLGGDEEHPMHEAGVRVVGAWIEGDLNLDRGSAVAPLTLLKCKLGDISARDAYLPGLMLRGSHIASLAADSLKTSANVVLDSGFKATGTTRIQGAQIGGNLECGAGSFSSTHADGVTVGPALAADGATIKGHVFLDSEFSAFGEVRLLGAQISGNLEASGGTFRNAGDDDVPVGDALSADGADIEGDVFLDAGFSAVGTVRLLGVRIGGDLYCDDGTFRAEKKDAELSAVNAHGLQLTGNLWMRRGKFAGIVDFSAAYIGSLVDDADCWPSGHLFLDGFRYDRISAGATDAKARIAWLKRQYPGHLADEFKPQPWEQAIKVLREMGHPFEARQIAIEKQRVWRKSWQRGMWHWRRVLIALPRWILHKAYGVLAAYGYRPMWTVWWMIGVCLCCSAVYYDARNAGLFGPSDAVIQTAPDLANCGADPRTNNAKWTEPGCKLPPEYSTFHPLLYSLDVILPLVDLHQEQEWGPILTEGKAGFTPVNLLRYVVWFEILFGWITSLLLVAVLGRLVEKD